MPYNIGCLQHWKYQWLYTLFLLCLHRCRHQYHNHNCHPFCFLTVRIMITFAVNITVTTTIIIFNTYLWSSFIFLLLYCIRRPQDPSNPVRVGISYNFASYYLLTLMDISCKTTFDFRILDLWSPFML